MTDHDFLRAILDDPGDTALRLIYADWLEEHGDSRGEFIRVQCRLDFLISHTPPDHDTTRGHKEKFCRRCRWLADHRHEWEALRRRERELAAIIG